VINYWSINCLAQWSGKKPRDALRRRRLFAMMILDGQAARVDLCFDQIRGREDWSGALGA
jgi:hypothetical protein